jgi:hypothetical protein
MLSTKEKTKKRENSKYFKYLPKKYWFSHQFCFFIHDQLVQIISSGERDGIFNVTVEFQDAELVKKIHNLSGEQLLDWLENNGYEDVVYELTYRQLCVALLSDLCHFVYEALDCSKKEKLTVTYALLRKPFKENLFYLEWLLTDSGDFLQKFHLSETKSLIISGSGTVSRERRKEIIKGAMKKTKYGEWINLDFIYQLRYDKRVAFGMEQLWQKANHLITSYEFLETEEKNINFIFSNYEDHKSQWDYLYSFLPILLFHTLEVAKALIGTFAIIQNEKEQNLIELRTVIGFLLWLERRPRPIRIRALQEIAKSIEDAQLYCPKCKKQMFFKKEDLRLFCKQGIFKCRSCQYKIDLLFKKE